MSSLFRQGRGSILNPTSGHPLKVVIKKLKRHWAEKEQFGQLGWGTRIVKLRAREAVSASPRNTRN